MIFNLLYLTFAFIEPPKDKVKLKNMFNFCKAVGIMLTYFLLTTFFLMLTMSICFFYVHLKPYALLSLKKRFKVMIGLSFGKLISKFLDRLITNCIDFFTLNY